MNRNSHCGYALPPIQALFRFTQFIHHHLVFFGYIAYHSDGQKQLKHGSLDSRDYERRWSHRRQRFDAAVSYQASKLLITFQAAGQIAPLLLKQWTL